MFRTLLIGSLLLGLMLFFLFIKMRNEKASIYNNQFSRNYSQHEVRLKIKRTIYYKEDLNNLKVINGKYYLEKFDSQNIVCIDNKGSELHRWGGLNSAIKASFITSWDLNEGVITIVDGQLNKIFCLREKENSLISEKKLEFKVIRAARLNKNEYIVKTPDPKDTENETFKKINLKTYETHDLTYPLPNVEHPDFTLDGYFINGVGNGFHICYKTGFFFAFDSLGNHLYNAATIDQTPPPQIITTGRAKRYHPLTIRVNRSASADENTVYILSGRKAINDQTTGDAIDCYSSSDGHYKESFNLPYFKGLAAFDIFKTKNGLVALYQNYIVEYSL